MKSPLFTVCVVIALLAFTLPGLAQREKPPIRPSNDPTVVAYERLGASLAVLIDEPRIGRLRSEHREVNWEKGLTTFHFNIKTGLPQRGEFLDYKAPFALSFVFMTDELVKELVQRPDV